jgi:hypothetical protein
MTRILVLIASLFLGSSASAQTYYQAPFTETKLRESMAPNGGPSGSVAL